MIANSPSNAFRSTTSADFQTPPAYDQMAGTAAALLRTSRTTSINTNILCYPSTPYLIIRTQTRCSRLRLTTFTLTLSPVTGASPQSQSIGSRREASSAPTTRALDNIERSSETLSSLSARPGMSAYYLFIRCPYKSLQWL